MHLIDGSGNVDGAFTEGNPSTGQVATAVTADWLNAVQAEIAAVIEGAGLELDKEDNAQLVAAIQAIVAAQPGGAVRFFIGGALQVRNQVVAALMGHTGTIKGLHARVLTAPSGGPCTVAIKKNGAVVGNLIIADGTYIQSVITGMENTTFVETDYIQVDILSTNGAADLLLAVV